MPPRKAKTSMIGELTCFSPLHFLKLQSDAVSNPFSQAVVSYEHTSLFCRALARQRVLIIFV